MLASEGEHVRIDLADLLPSARILRRQRPGQCAGATSDMQYAPGTTSAQHDPQPTEVVELEMGRVGEVDVGDIHAALTEETPRWAPRIDLSGQLPTPGNRSNAVLPVRHPHRLTHAGFRTAFERWVAGANAEEFSQLIEESLDQLRPLTAEQPLVDVG